MLERTVSLHPGRPFRTARLILRPYSAEDLPHLTEMLGREDVCRYLPWPPMTPEEARAKLEQRLLQTHLGADGDALVPAAVEAASGRVVGEFMLSIRSTGHRQGEVGWIIHPDFQGRGFGTEGARAMLRVGFEDLGLHRIQAGADPRNVASLRVMERLGMRPEAHFVASEFIKGEWVDEVVFGLLESEWRASIV